MKIAGVSLTYNDGYKLNEWHDYYLQYKDQFDFYIIVDNNSEEGYRDLLKSTFDDGCVIIERTSNGGCTAAFNDGIRYALEKTDADAIVIIGNDIKLTKNCISEMYKFLYSRDDIGMVSSAMLYKDSDVIDNYGHGMKNMVVNCSDEGRNIHEISEFKKFTDLLTGGFTMAKRIFYEKVGLQDETIFMYCDELDTAYKAKMYGYKLGVIANEYAWHQHKNPPKTGKRSSASRYLICRNRIYLAKKYESRRVVLLQCFRGIIKVPIIYLYRFFLYRNLSELKDGWYSFVGGVHGIVGYMKYNDYMDFNK